MSQTLRAAATSNRAFVERYSFSIVPAHLAEAADETSLDEIRRTGSRPVSGARVKLGGRRVSLIVRALVTLGAIYYLAQSVDLRLLLETIAGISLPLALAAICVLALQPLFATLRWSVILRALASTLAIKRLLHIIYIALFFNQVLPASVGGDVIRIVLARNTGASLRDAISSTAMDRVFMLLVLIGMFAASQLLVDAGQDVPRAYTLGIAALSLFLILALVLVAFDLLPVWRLPLPFVDRLEGLAHQTAVILKSPKTLALTVSVSLISHANIMLSMYLFMNALGANIALVDVLLFAPIVLLAAVIPISFGGWGVREAVMISVFAQIGISQEVSLSASLLLGTASILITLPGLWLFSRSGLTFPDSQMLASTIETPRQDA